MASNRKLQANIVAMIGASGSGKTSGVMNELKRDKPSRLLVWDTKGEFHQENYGIAVTSLKDVVQHVKTAKRGFKLCYQPQGTLDSYPKQFDLFCMIAYELKKLTFVAEELSDVTRASASPSGWRKLTTQGRTEGINIYGLSQSPAQIDKNFYGNCTRVRTGRLNFDSHLKTMANCLSCSIDEIRNLPPLHYIERNMNTGEVIRANL